MKGFIIAIDGPVASGKGTISSLLVKKLNAVTFYSGGLYRAVTYFCLQNGINIHDEQAVIKAVKDLNMEVRDTAKNGNYSTVFLSDADISKQIITPAVVKATPVVSTYPEVREIVVGKQQAFSRELRDHGKIIVMGGRDTATVVFPDADLKLFLTADVRTRAARRLEQHKTENAHISIEEMIEDIQRRDEMDMTRSASPLSSDPEKDGYIVLDNSDLNEEQTLDKIMNLLEDKGLIESER